MQRASQSGPAPGASTGKQAKIPSRGCRRAHERVPIDTIATVAQLDNYNVPGQSWQCRVADISRGGLGLKSKRMVHQGTRVLIAFALGNGEKRALCGLVRAVHYEEGAGYTLGLQFEALPTGNPVREWMTSQGIKPGST